ncbi:MAG TPA: hypothetical protein VIJ88_00305 [Candidatus Paceibacterota bacterium]
MQGGIINTLFALLFAMLIVSIIWGLSLYFTELGSQEGMKEAKNIFMGGITLLFLLMCVYAAVEWARGVIGL